MNTIYPDYVVALDDVILQCAYILMAFILTRERSLALTVYSVLKRGSLKMRSEIR